MVNLEMLNRLQDFFSEIYDPKSDCFVQVGSSIKGLSTTSSDIDLRLLSNATEQQPVLGNMGSRLVFRSSTDGVDYFCRVLHFSELQTLSGDVLSKFLWHTSPFTPLAGNVRYWASLHNDLTKRFHSTLDAEIVRKYIAFRSDRNQLRSASVASQPAVKRILLARCISMGVEILFLAAGRPYPYSKWLLREARLHLPDGEAVSSLLSMIEGSEHFDEAQVEDLHGALVSTCSTVLTADHVGSWWAYMDGQSY